MTARDRLFETAVIDGGAIGAIAIDVATRAVIAGHDGPALRELVSERLLDVLIGGAPAGPARELMIAGRDRALYCMIHAARELIVVAAPATMSVALGWALVRTLLPAEPAAAGEPP